MLVRACSAAGSFTFLLKKPHSQASRVFRRKSGLYGRTLSLFTKWSESKTDSKRRRGAQYHEEKKLLYTSLPYDTSIGTHDQIRIYEHRPYDPTRPHINKFSGKFEPWHSQPLNFLGTLSLVTEQGLPVGLSWIQGGIVTPNNHLLLVCDTHGGDGIAGLHLFDLMTGVRRSYTPWPGTAATTTCMGIQGKWSEGSKSPEAKLDEFESVAIVPNAVDDAFLFVMLIRKHPDWEGYDSLSILQYDTMIAEQRDLL
jgi:hypothetical protein